MCVCIQRRSLRLCVAVQASARTQPEFAHPSVSRCASVRGHGFNTGDIVKQLALAIVIVLAALATACGGGSVSVSITPTTATVPPGATQQFTANVSNASDSTVTWQVDSVVGGNATDGTISTTGLYTAPTTIPGSALSPSQPSPPRVPPRVRRLPSPLPIPSPSHRTTCSLP